MKKAIVIGASSGIGRELAKILSGIGYTVGVMARRACLLNELRTEINHLAYDLYDLTPDEIALIEKKFEISNLKSEIPKGEKSEIPKSDPKGKPEGL
jgi:short-subunit dehydrogenase